VVLKPALLHMIAALYADSGRYTVGLENEKQREAHSLFESIELVTYLAIQSDLVQRAN
jgi:hypothetical protein